MANISVSLPSDGTTADVNDYNPAINTIVNEINGGLDNSNINSAAAIAGSKLANNSIDIGAKASTFDGWIAVSDSWSYASATTVTVPSDATTKYSKGDLVKFVQTSTKYFRITNVASTTLTLQAEANGVEVANAAITGIYYSKVATPQGAPLNNVPWWQEIGRNTLTSTGDTITISSLPLRKHLLVIYNLIPTGGTITATIDFNNDTGNNYSSRNAANNTSDATSTSRANVILDLTSASNSMHYGEARITNISAQEKLVHGWTVVQGTAGASNLPTRMIYAGKWANTSAQINRVDVRNVGVGDYAIGSEVVVLGRD